MVQIIKNILSDISLLYKNFLHWNISKILIMFYSVILSLLISVAFFLLLYLFYLIWSWIWIILAFIILLFWVVFLIPFFWIQVLVNVSDIINLVFNNNFIYYNLFSENKLYAIFYLVFLIFFTIIFFVKMTKLNINYLDSNKLSYLKIFSIEFKKTFKLIKITLINSFILSIPFLLFTIIYFIFGWSGEMFLGDWWVKIFFMALSFLMYILFFYLSFKTIYSYIVFLYKKENLKSYLYIKESFIITKNKFFLFIIPFLILFLLAVVLFIIWYYLNSLFWISSNFIYSIIIFLFFTWLFEMFLVSFYKNTMLENNNFKMKEEKDDLEKEESQIEDDLV